jgi:uncharacterized membrane protein
MLPLIVLAVLFVVLTVLGRLGIPSAFGWHVALRFALAGMFLLTASAHWGKRRADLIRMVSPALPRPDILVALTGILEILGAVGLMIPTVAPYAALGLSPMLLGLFPANVHAARQRLQIGGSPVTPLGPRAAIQVVFVAATLAVFFCR